MHYRFGYLLNKRYIFLKYINYGAFSQIWLIYDFIQNEYCVGKVIDESNIDTGINEITVLRKIKRLMISNNNICNNLLLFKEIIESEKEIIIIENLQDLNLKDLIYDYNLENEEKDLLIELITKQLNPVLLFLKNNSILHTDIKPENIFIKIKNNNNNNIKNEFNDFIKEIKNLKCKPKDKIKEINKIINSYHQNSLFSSYLNSSDCDSNTDSDDSDYDINTDSDIISDYDINDNINDFLNQIIYKKKDKDKKKKKINFNINDCIFSIGDFGNAIDYSLIMNH